MPGKVSFSFILVFALLTNAFGQQQASPTNPQQKPASTDEDVVRINSNLVQVDAVVTDKNGKQVTDLTAEDFELFEDGRAQQIRNFAYISTVGRRDLDTTTPVNIKRIEPVDGVPTPTVHIRPEQVRRTVALLVDDLGLSADSVAYVRQALRKYIDQQMQPTDLVAIIRTSAGVGAMLQFTSDKRQLLAAVDHIKWYQLGRGRFSAVSPFNQIDSNDVGLELNGAMASYQLNVSAKEFFGGTIGALSFVAHGLKDFPGRKSIVLMSDNLPISNKEVLGNDIMRAVNHIIEEANRSSVVIYTLDPRGFPKVALTTEDSQYNLAANQIDGRMLQRRIRFRVSQDGMNYLATQTGGLFFQGTTDLNDSIVKALDDQKGYYLLAYRPEDSTLDATMGRGGFHQLAVKLRRSGMTVRARSGFYSTTGTGSGSVSLTRDEQVLDAIRSPFTAGNIHVRMTSLFANDKIAGSFIRTLLHIDARDLSFSKDTEGWYKASFEVATISFDENGKAADRLGRTRSLRVRSESYQRILEEGFVYFSDLKVKKPGAYQLRSIVRDAASSRVGAASQFVEVPNLKDNHIVLSGIIVNGETATEPKSKETSNSSTNLTTGPYTPDNAVNAIGLDGNEKARQSSAVRRLKRNEVLEFGYYIYNAQLDRSGRPKIQTQVRLLHEGQLVFAGKMLALELSNQTDLKRIIAGGKLKLGLELAPGDYTLQVVVLDLLAAESKRATTQWMEFEVLP